MTTVKGEKQSDGRAEARSLMSGLEYMQKLAAGELPQSGMGRLMGFRLAEVSEGYAVVTVVPEERHYNGIGIAHGGLAATLLDSATGCAINTMMPAGRIFTTLEMKINYVRPIRGGGTVRCEARVIHVGSRTAYAEGHVLDEQGKLYAHGTA
ncbi:MAG TPA: PaaI family thioesterase, partial [Pyrinomonadaceae bacterium]|nr:PaaI family thioesterase [Pyrinomonadaceae bacterium]